MTDRYDVIVIGAGIARAMNLDDEVHYRHLTLATLAKHMLMSEENRSDNASGCKAHSHQKTRTRESLAAAYSLDFKGTLAQF
jgi:hypothetical protein